MSGATPGPWRPDKDHDDAEITVVGRPAWPCTRFGIKGDWDVCKIDADEPDADANARLIAAAPELLATGREIDRLSLVILSAVKADQSGQYEAVAAAIIANRAAIAKATAS